MAIKDLGELEFSSFILGIENIGILAMPRSFDRELDRIAAFPGRVGDAASAELARRARMEAE